MKKKKKKKGDGKKRVEGGMKRTGEREKGKRWRSAGERLSRPRASNATVVRDQIFRDSDSEIQIQSE